MMIFLFYHKSHYFIVPWYKGQHHLLHNVKREAIAWTSQDENTSYLVIGKQLR